MAITSFYHAIYKRLWGVARAANAHMDDGTMDGGFTLLSPGEPHWAARTARGARAGNEASRRARAARKAASCG